MGITPGQSVVICMQDCVDWPVAFLGSIYAGAVPIPVATNIPKDIFQDIINFIDCQALFASDTAVPAFADCTQLLISRQKMQQWYNTAPSDILPVESHPDAPGYMGLSSGTTSAPKVAVFRHQILFDIVQSGPSQLYKMNSSSIMLSLPKMSWGYGLHNTISYTLSVGATSVVISGPPSPTVVFQTANKYRPTIIAATPSMLRKLLGPASEKYQFPNSVIRIQCSGEDIPESLYNNFYDKFRIHICNSIGQLEVANTNYATSTTPDQQGTVGKPLPGVKIKIVNDDLECLPGQVGEIYVQTDTIATYYLKNYKATKETFFGNWVKTGDSGYIDKNGNLVFVGRVDDIFKVDDLIVSPVEIENQVLKYPDIENVAVFGVKNVKDIYEIHLCIIPGTNFVMTDFKKHLENKLLKHQRPRQIHVVVEFPETATTKKDRKTLAKMTYVD